MKTFQDFSPYNGLVQGPKDCSKGFKRFQTMNKGLIKWNDHSLKKKKKYVF